MIHVILFMPNKRNAKKALRQNIKRAALNRMRKDAYKDALKKAVKSNGQDKELLRKVQQALDKAAKRGVIKKNTAARKLSRLMKKTQKTT
jgi:small subunit ribosomal protein S20